MFIKIFNESKIMFYSALDQVKHIDSSSTSTKLFLAFFLIAITIIIAKYFLQKYYDQINRKIEDDFKKLEKIIPSLKDKTIEIDDLGFPIVPKPWGLKISPYDFTRSSNPFPAISLSYNYNFKKYTNYRVMKRIEFDKQQSTSKDYIFEKSKDLILSYYNDTINEQAYKNLLKNKGF